MKTALAFLSLSLPVLALAPNACADVKLPSIFSDHMVLQRDAAVPVWGWADAGESVTATIMGQTKTAVAGPNGKWMLKLDKLKAGESTTLVVKGKNTITIQDVLVGEVWLCSGQSNMVMQVKSSNDAEKETAAANFPKIRMFHETSGPAAEPQEKSTPLPAMYDGDHVVATLSEYFFGREEKGAGEWRVCDPQTAGGFSATSYFFGREIHKTTGLPVGLIDSSVGATPIEAWTSLDAQKDLPETKPIFERWAKMQAEWDPVKAKEEAEKKVPRSPFPVEEPRLSVFHPATLFNGKISPLIPYAIRGAIWYQGESNASSASGKIYGLQLATMIKDWRARWGQGDFPFGWVQLPNMNKAQTSPVQDGGWSLVREGMRKTLDLPNTGMAITVDVGDPKNIHPKNKQEVGRRLSLWALAKVYGEKNAASGPLPAGHQIHDGRVIVSFQNTEGGLVAKDGALKGFAIAGEDKKWVKAEAKIEGDKVLVSSPEVEKPVAVRYAWADNPDCNLYNGAGLPASPFRTDDWEMVPAPKKASAQK